MKRLKYWLCLILLFTFIFPQRTAKPVIHGKHLVAITGKPLGATAGATIFSRGGNAVDAACAMLAATCTMYDVLSWGGETQALVYNPKTKKVIGINALGIAPTGATADFYKEKEYKPPFIIKHKDKLKYINYTSIAIIISILFKSDCKYFIL